MSAQSSDAVLAVIPARGGSKGIPRKNLRLLAGKPLIAHSIETALACPSIQRTVVTTDDAEIAEVAAAFGAEVPFLRPPELAQDDTPDLPVFVHCLEYLNQHEGYRPDIVVQLRPTSPLRRVAVVEESIKLLRTDPEADSIRVVCVPDQSPFKMWTIQPDSPYLKQLIETGIPEQYNQPRQCLPRVYWQIGYVDVVRGRTILQKKSMSGDRIRPLILDHSNVVDIDDEISFDVAEAIVRRDAY